jgi:chromosome segregation ATPase
LQLSAQLREAVSTREQKLCEAQEELRVTRERLIAAEAQAKRTEFELTVLRGEAEGLRKLLQTSESEVDKWRSEAHQIREAQGKLRDDAFGSVRQSETRLSVAQTEFDARLQAVQRTHREELTRSEETLKQLRRELEEATERENKLKAVLDESRQKRVALKRARDDLQEELTEARNVITVQVKELQQARDAIERVSAEYERVKSALQFEVEAQEQQVLLSPSSFRDGSLFNEWKRHQKAKALTNGAQHPAGRVQVVSGKTIRR